MTLLQAIILGIVQGLTEYLPVSSSAHLVLVPYLLQWKIPEAYVFPFDVLVQLGTLFAVIIYFWKDLFQIIVSFFRGIINKKPFAEADSRLGWYIIVATFITGVIGLIFKNKVEAVFNSPVHTAIFLFVTTGILFLAEFLGKRTRSASEMTWLDSIIIGFAQAISIFPGISRSGATISAGMLRNLDRRSASRFSFFLCIPSMLASGLLSVLDIVDLPDLGTFLPLVAIGFIAAGVVGYVSIHWLLKYVQQKSFKIFGFYCVGIATLTLVVSLIRA